MRSITSTSLRTEEALWKGEENGGTLLNVRQGETRVKFGLHDIRRWLAPNVFRLQY
jgi:hypothetical protein